MVTLFRRLLVQSRKLLCLPLNLARFPRFLGATSPPTRPVVDAMDISGHSFASEAVNIIQQIAGSRFIAFDFEFSGVAARRQGGGSGKLNLQEYYEDLRSAAQIYQILQVGLTVVTEDVDNVRYVLRPYNFNLSPLPAFKESIFKRTWSFNSGAVSFLIRNGFDISLPLTSGVHYLSRQEEDQVRRKMVQDDEARLKIPDMVLKDDDTLLVDYIKSSITGWQALPKDQQDSYLNIPAENVKSPLPATFNRYQIRLTHQIVRNEYPGLKTHGMGHFVQITNPTDKQQENEKEIRHQQRERDIANAVGFRWILEAIMGGDITKMPHHYVRSAFEEADCPKDIAAFLHELQGRLQSQKRAIFGHNCFTDVINLYRCFFGDLPERVEEFGQKLQELFPLILDTKHFATLGSNRWANTALSSVEEDLATETKPAMHVPRHFERYQHSAVFHEAGYDSFVTAKIGLKLAARLMRNGKKLGLLPKEADDKVDAKSRAQQKDIARDLTGFESTGGETQSLADNVVSALTNPLAKLQSALAGTNHGQIENTANPLEVRRKKETVAPVKAAALKSNIFELLEDEPEESRAPDGDGEEVPAAGRIGDLVKKGELIPRWDHDAEFWSTVGNKLQTNACQEPFMDLSKGRQRDS